MMDSKEGIEKVVPVDAQAAGLLDPSFLRPGIHDAATADPPRERAGSPTGSCASLDEHSRWESNCLYVRVLRDSDAILEQDRKVPEYCWNAGIRPAHIGSIIITYNSTRSLVTRYSPYYLMFGRRPRLPIDLLFLMRRTQILTRTIDEYIASLYDRLRKSLVIMQDCAVKEAQRQKGLYDRKVGAVELRPGDNVLV